MSKANRIREIAEEMKSLLDEAKQIAKNTKGCFFEHYKAYVFDQIKEHLDKGNPYNRDMNDLADEIESVDTEPEEDEDEDEDYEYNEQ
jgi:hypothetical protein